MPAPADEDDRRPLGRDGTPPAAARRAGVRARWRAHLSSRRKHYAIVGLVALDVLVLLADILITLVTCELGRPDAGWVATVREVGRIAGLVFSALFLAELAASVWAFGLGYFRSWFHCFDAFVIVTSFAIDVAARGLVEEIGSLVIVLRLWRLVKIVEEVSVGASEGMEELEARLVALERDKAELEARLVRLDAREGGGG